MKPQLRWPQIVVAALILLAATAPGRLAAQEVTCVPLATGVPGLQDGPDWFLSGGDDRLDDPRWAGAVSHTDGTLSAQHVDFRAVRRPDSLFLSWLVKLDPGITVADMTGAEGDQLWFGLQQGGGTPLVFNVRITGSAVAQALATQWTATAFELTGVSPPPAVPIPAWFTNGTRLWIVSNGNDPSAPYAVWAFQTVVPVGVAGSPLSLATEGAEFKAFYQFYVKVENAGIVPYSWPRGLGVISIEFPQFIPDPSTWEPFSFGDHPVGPCLGEITIASRDDFGRTPPPTSQIDFKKPPAVQPTNMMFVRPTNLTSATTIPANSIGARFWIANWGSTAAATPNPDVWTEITPDPFNPPRNPLSLGPGVAGPTNQIAFGWVPTCEAFNFYTEVEVPSASMPAACDPDKRFSAYISFLADGTRVSHQCLLVELDGFGQLTFRRKSYWRNMDFVEIASPAFSRDAKISVRGAPPEEGSDPKTVYLFVETINMPPRAFGAGLGRADERRNIRPAGERASNEAANANTNRDTLTASAFLHESPADTVYPTYRVHAYRQVAATVTRAGQSVPVLRPQTSFGYWVDHRGALRGWRHRLEGATVTQVGPHLYRVTVPHDSAVIVTTTIEALHPHRLALSGHGGIAVPHGALGNTYDLGLSLTGNLELWLTSILALEGLFGYHRFSADAVTLLDLEVTQISGGLKAYSGWGPVRLFAHGGGGVYRFDPGSTERGVHGGAGIQLNPTPSIGVDIAYTFHHAFTAGAGAEFSSLQAGFHLRFQ